MLRANERVQQTTHTSGLARRSPYCRVHQVITMLSTYSLQIRVGAGSLSLPAPGVCGPYRARTDDLLGVNQTL